MALFHVLVLLVAIGAQKVDADQRDDRTSLHLLNILPFPDSRPNAGWDRAYELIPAAQLAVDQINNASHILPGFKLSLVNVDTEACGFNLVTKSLVNTYAKVFTPSTSLNVVGFTGLFCSAVADAITQIFGGPKVVYLQFTGSTTPLHQNSSQYPWLVHFISSTTIFNDAITEMIREYGWTTISVVFESNNVLHEYTVADLNERAKNTEEFNVTALVPIMSQFEGTHILNELNSRVVYISTPDTDTARLMCEAYKRNAVYPGFVYFLLEKTLPVLLSQARFTDCTPNQISEVLEGVIFLNYRLSNAQTSEMVSNMTYQEYWHQYLQYLMKMELATNTTLSKDNIYANVMYDQIWASALVLQKSLDTLHAANIDIRNLHLLQTKQFSSIMRNSLRNVSFEGASGFVEFYSDKERSRVVEIFQVINGTSKLVGTYDPGADEQLAMDLQLSLPPDNFDVRTILLPSWVSIFFNIYIIFWVLVTTFVMAFLYIFRHRPEVKASSPSLGLVMFIGCYFLFVATLMRNITKAYLVTNYHVFTFLCNIEAWFGMIGLTLIFAALLMQLVRIYRIFKAHGKMSRFWKDKYMILSILAICSSMVVLLILWTAIDNIHIVTTTTYRSRAVPHFFEQQSECSNSTLWIWVLIFLVYNGVLMLIIVLVAVKTRKIRLSNFKNTKKINTMITLTCMTLGILAPLWYFITEDVPNHFITCFALSCTGVYCQLFIFIPRVFIAIIKMKAERTNGENSINCRREYQFSTAEL